MKKSLFVLPLMIFTLASCNANPNPTPDPTPTPTPTPEVEYVTATFKNYDGSLVFEDKKVTKGTTPVCTETPSRPSTSEYTYTFIGWSPELGPINVDTTYTAQYDETPILKTKELEITFKNNGVFTGDFTGDNKNAFLTWANGQTNVIKDVSYKTGCYAQVNEVFEGMTSCILGAKKKDGNLKLDFNYKVVGVELTIQAYYNQYTTSGQLNTYVDNNSKLKINDEADYIDLPTETGIVPDEALATRTYGESNAITSLELSSTNPTGRVFIHYMKLTYIEK